MRMEDKNIKSENAHENKKGPEIDSGLSYFSLIAKFHSKIFLF